MAQPIFPTLTDAVTSRVYKPAVKSFDSKLGFDPTIRTRLEDGEKSTSQPTPNIPKLFSVMYQSIPLANRNEILAFESSTVYYNVLPFTWTDEPSSDDFTVMYADSVRWQYTAEDAQRYDVFMVMEETQANF